MGLSLKGSLHAVEGTLVVLACAVELLVLLSKTAVDLLSDSGHLELGADNLGFLLFESSLSFLEGRLELLLLHLKTLSALLKLVDGAATLTKLICQVVDFI